MTKRTTFVFVSGITSIEKNFSEDFSYWSFERSKLDDTKYNFVFANTGFAPDPHCGAVKLFSILTGYPVYFGEEYSKNFGIPAELPNNTVAEFKEWTADNPITILGHSNGTLIAYQLQYLLAKNHWKDKYGRETHADMICAVVGINSAFGSPLATWIMGASYKDLEVQFERGLKEKDYWDSSFTTKFITAIAFLIDSLMPASILGESRNTAYPFSINNLNDIIQVCTGTHVAQNKKCTAAWYLTMYGQKELQELWFEDDILPHNKTLYINLCGNKYNYSALQALCEISLTNIHSFGFSTSAMGMLFMKEYPEFTPNIVGNCKELINHDGVLLAIHQAFPFMVDMDKQREITNKTLSNAYIGIDTSDVKPLESGIFNWMIIEGGGHGVINNKNELFRETVLNRTMELITIFNRSKETTT